MAARVMPDPADSDDENGGRGTGRGRGKLDPAPSVTVLGIMDGNIAVRLGWKHGMHIVSNSRFKFMREDLEMNVVDDPEEYLF